MNKKKANTENVLMSNPKFFDNFPWMRKKRYTEIRAETKDMVLYFLIKATEKKSQIYCLAGV